MSVGVPRKMFTFDNVGGRWDIHPDGKRFAAVALFGNQADNPITVVLNWFADLRK